MCLFNGNGALYINPALDVMESIAMASFFLLMTNYVMPDRGCGGAFKAGHVDFRAQDNEVWYQVNPIR